MTLTLRNKLTWLIIPLFAFLLSLVIVQSSSAIDQIPTPDPIPGSYGLEATKPKDPPTTAATITTPGNNATFTESPITVSGICTTDLLVQVYNNNVLVGSVMCTGGSFSLQISLFAGVNELTAIVYDELGQAGPTSRVVTVNYDDTNFVAFGELITLTSSYGRRSAAAGNELTWPLQLSGGTGPYAFSIDWGDGSPVQLLSQALAGVVNISHVYKSAGIYQINIQVTDANEVSAFLQLIAVANGKVEGSIAPTVPNTSNGSTTNSFAVWIPAIVAVVMLLPVYWLGRRSQLVSLHQKMLKERDNYDKDQSAK